MSRLLLVSMVAAVLCGPSRADAGPPGEAKCETRSELVDRLRGYMGAAEEVRLSDDKHMSSWPESSRTDIVVEECPAGEVMGVTFYRGYNGTIDPAWVYVVGVDSSGGFHRIAGFRTSELSEVTKTWMSRADGIRRTDALDIARTYFRLVEGWRPGLVGSSAELGSAKAEVLAHTAKGVSGCTCEPIVRLGKVSTVRALVFDADSGRAECIEMELSSEKGLKIAFRLPIIDRPRLEY